MKVKIQVKFCLLMIKYKRNRSWIDPLISDLRLWSASGTLALPGL